MCIFPTTTLPPLLDWIQLQVVVAPGRLIWTHGFCIPLPVCMYSQVLVRVRVWVPTAQHPPSPQPWIDEGFVEYLGRFVPRHLLPPNTPGTVMGGREYCTEGMAHDHCLFMNQLTAHWTMLLHAPDNYLTFREPGALVPASIKTPPPFLKPRGCTIKVQKK